LRQALAQKNFKKNQKFLMLLPIPKGTHTFWCAHKGKLMKLYIPMLLASLILACASPQRPYHFTLPSSSTMVQTLPTMRAVLAENGLETVFIDEEAGIMRTRWMDTGFLYGKVQGLSATLVRRYAIVLIPQSDGSLGLTLRAEVKRCAQDGFEVSGEMVTGACESVHGLVSTHQNDLNTLGTQLQARIQTL